MKVKRANAQANWRNYYFLPLAILALLLLYIEYRADSDHDSTTLSGSSSGSGSAPPSQTLSGPYSSRETFVTVDKDVKVPIPPSLSSLEEVKLHNEDALFRLGRKYKTDKVSSHAYHKTYGQFFDRSATTKILEVGISNGNSIRMWLEYFPNAEIHGMELNRRADNWKISNPRFFPWIGSMTNRTYLRWFRKQHIGKPFDIIIDDGAHSRESNQVCWEELFPTEVLREGGYYSIEDVGTGYGHRAPKPSASTDIAKQWIDVIHRDYFGDAVVADTMTAKGTFLQTRKSDQQIENMFIGDQIILLRKRKDGPLRTGVGPNKYHKEVPV